MATNVAGVCPEESALLRAVLEHPEEDLVRLILADWYEENGQADRGEFVRVQCEIEVTGQCRCLPPCSSRIDYWCPAHALRRREERLMATDVPHPAGGLWSQWEAWLGLDRVAAPTGESWFRRGFAAVVHLPLAVFLAHARDLFSRHPITAVVLTCRGPDDLGYGWGWYQGPYDAAGDYIPADIARHFKPLPSHWVWETEAAAHAALSAAAVSLGRELANLPPLEAVK